MEQFNEVVQKEKKTLLELLTYGNLIFSSLYNDSGHLRKLHLEMVGQLPPLKIFFPFLEELTTYYNDQIHLSILDNHARTLKRLKLIFGSNNDLESVPNISKLSFLEDLDLSRNAISSSRGFEHLSSLDKLKYLNLSCNMLVSLKGFNKLSGCQSLEFINLRENRISDLCGLEPFSDFRNPVSLDLSYNKVAAFNISKDVPGIKSLVLDYNQISGVVSLRNLSSLKTLGLSDNKITALEIFENLPKLDFIDVELNPIKRLSGLENLPCLTEFKSIHESNCTQQEINDLIDYVERIGLESDWDECYSRGEPERNHLSIYGPFPKSTFKVNDYITLNFKYYSLEDRYLTKIYVAGKEFLSCKFLLLTVPVDELETCDDFDSIDEAAEGLNASLEYPERTSIRIPPETEFWGHCSNLQAWAENDYDTRLLSMNLAFPLLKKLTLIGDPIAKRVFKEEIAKRYASGHPTVVEYLKIRGYLNYLSKDELDAISF